jgi:hypothetical protein
VKTEPAPDAEAIIIDSDGGPSDRDEINCEERLAAVNSPIKGKKRASSDVSPLLFVTLLSLHPRSASCSNRSERTED